jgi:hypothetical protein
MVEEEEEELSRSRDVLLSTMAEALEGLISKKYTHIRNKLRMGIERFDMAAIGVRTKAAAEAAEAVEEAAIPSAPARRIRCMHPWHLNGHCIGPCPNCGMED